jgi:hypothetical protein
MSLVLFIYKQECIILLRQKVKLQGYGFELIANAIVALTLVCVKGLRIGSIFNNLRAGGINLTQVH